MLYIGINYLSNSLVQCGQRVASMAISLLQKGQTLVVGAAGGSATGFLPMPLSIFMALTTKKSTSATMRKLIILNVHLAYFQYKVGKVHLNKQANQRGDDVVHKGIYNACERRADHHADC